MKIMDQTTPNRPLETTNSLPKKHSGFWVELIKLILLAIFVIIPFRLYVAQPFIVDGHSMDPTFNSTDYLIVEELTYHFKGPERGSVITFKYPKDPSKYFIKRIIGLPGETVILTDGKVSIKNTAHPDGFNLDEPYIKLPKLDTSSYTLGPDEYFVMGDNRAGSSDSRSWGPVPKANLIGRPILRFLPPALWPGDETEQLNSNK